MKPISTADLQQMVPNLVDHVSEQYLILNEKKKQIVGAIQIIEPPKSYVKETQYKVVYSRKRSKYEKKHT